ncbi:MAG: hypothetical protein ACK45H_07015 [Bacteroidota bacterium]|jgi:hypothetical protein
MSNTNDSRKGDIRRAGTLIDGIRMACHELAVRPSGNRLEPIKDIRRKCGQLLSLSEHAFPESFMTIKSLIVQITGEIEVMNELTENGLEPDIPETVERMLKLLSELEGPTEIGSI